MQDTPKPLSMTMHGRSRVLEVHFSDGAQFRIPIELMRVYSPSAEVQGHGPEQAILQLGKREVGITSIEPVGHYGVRPVFSDGHETGIFTFTQLYELGRDQQALWERYLTQLRDAGLDRDGKPLNAG